MHLSSINFKIKLKMLKLEIQEVAFIHNTLLEKECKLREARALLELVNKFEAEHKKLSLAASESEKIEASTARPKTKK